MIIPIKINQLSFKVVVLVTGLLLLLVVGKDLVHASIRNYSFYLSESLLFGIFWILFIPVLLIVKKLRPPVNPMLLSVLLSFLHVVCFSFLVYLLSTLFLQEAFGFSRTFVITATDNGIVCIIVYGIYGYLTSHDNSAAKKAVQSQPIDKIKVNYQNRKMLIACEEILYVKSEKPYIAITTSERTYLQNGTLKLFLAEKAATGFIQVHKSTLINKHHVVSYKSRKNGDYDLLMKDQKLVRASRNFSKNFKSFINSISLA